MHRRIPAGRLYFWFTGFVFILRFYVFLRDVDGGRDIRQMEVSSNDSCFLQQQVLWQVVIEGSPPSHQPAHDTFLLRSGSLTIMFAWWCRSSAASPYIWQEESTNYFIQHMGRWCVLD